jgi:fused signal recognition particle receptor
MSDVGVETSVQICEALRKKIKELGVTDPGEIMGLIQEIVAEMMGDDIALNLSTTPSVILVIGVMALEKQPQSERCAVFLSQKEKKFLLRRLILSELLLSINYKSGLTARGLIL